MLDNLDITTAPTSSETKVKNIDQASIFVEWSSVGIDAELIVEGRMQEENIAEQATWFQLDFGSQILLNTDNSNHHLVLNELPFTELRTRVVYTAGTGNIIATICGKQIGG